MFEAWQTNAPTEGCKGLKAGKRQANNRGLCAGKGQAATLEQQRLTARGLGGSGARELEGFKRFKCLKPGKRMPQRRVLRV